MCDEMHLSDYSDDELAAELERRKNETALAEEAAAPFVDRALDALREKAENVLRSMFPDVPNPPPTDSGITFSYWPPTRPAPVVLTFMNLLGGYDG